MIRCRTCCMPNTRPDTAWVDGQCSACISYERRPTIDWDARKAELVKLLDRHDGRCIVPSSGGKDSTYQVLTLLEMGADVTVVTARTCHLTPIGRANIDNLAQHARTIEVVPNMTVRAKLNRLGLELVGDISWPEHCAIFTAPFRVASDLGIPLLFYGENPQDQYGGPAGADEAKRLTARWRSEFGGFLGLRPSDFIGMDGVTERDMSDYEMPATWARVRPEEMEAHFLGQYVQWSSHANASTAIENGMSFDAPSPANLWNAENLDNAQTGLHDHLMFRKFGFGRGCQQMSVDVRSWLYTREQGMEWIRAHDGIFPETYAGISVDEVLQRIGMGREGLEKVMDRFTDWSLFSRVDHCRPILKEFA